jgi:hypothetical protein
MMITKEEAVGAVEKKCIELYHMIGTVEAVKSPKGHPGTWAVEVRLKTKYGNRNVIFAVWESDRCLCKRLIEAQPTEGKSLVIDKVEVRVGDCRDKVFIVTLSKAGHVFYARNLAGVGDKKIAFMRL